MSRLSHTYTDIFEDLCDWLSTVLDIRHSVNRHFEAIFMLFSVYI